MVLLIHAFIALVHTILVIRYGQTSGAWDTILEMLALSHMSPPPPQPTLANVSADIRSFKTVKLMSSVEVAKEGPYSGQELRLKVDEDYQKRDPGLKAVVGQVYGSSRRNINEKVCLPESSEDSEV
ncbi:hypothetical protein ACO1O0_005007 [Amphichorda felina]